MFGGSSGRPELSPTQTTAGGRRQQSRKGHFDAMVRAPLAQGGQANAWRRVGKLMLDQGHEPDLYEFELCWRGHVLIVRPDMRCAVTYVNDFAGPNRSAGHKGTCLPQLNSRFVAVADRAGRPLLFLQMTQDVSLGDVIWTDYGSCHESSVVCVWCDSSWSAGDPYWTQWEQPVSDS